MKKPNFGSPVIDILEEDARKNKVQENFGIMSCGYKKTAEITLDLKTARLIRKIFKDKYSVHPDTRKSLDDCLADHIEACSE